ncbi:MAG: LysM peptidoglycan-binding domain-containing protein [Bacteroidetes bacterium]|nr:LysM peptidoglycan-binding domain-containing protein [Bacteroidota bacterium]
MRKKMPKHKVIGLFFLMLFLASLNVEAQPPQRKTAEQYIEEFRYAAMQEMRMYKIPASITLGQGLLESSCGNSRLAAECNNHFGIKCRKEWQGASCIEDDDAANECFRAYRNAMESYRDHSLFLSGSPRYQNLFTLDILNYKGWSQGLKSAGYATNPQYAVILNGIIAKYRLGKYDTMVIMGEEYFQKQNEGLQMANGLPVIYAPAGATPKDIADARQLGVWQIYRYNDLKRGDTLKPGEVVYLKPKKRQASVPQHIYREGENLRDISQKYGIKLKRVYHLNGLEPGQLPKDGEALQLQKKNQSAQESGKPAVMGNFETEAPIQSSIQDTAGGLYTVKSGETLFGLARRWGIEPAKLAAINGLPQQTVLKAGQLLVLRGDLKPAKTELSEPAKNATEMRQGMHVVMPGETLYSIARLYAVPLDSMMVWNGLSTPVLQSGQQLRVEAGKTKQTMEAEQYYTVQPGDTAFSIARKFGISLDELRLKNGLQDFQLKPGMKLRIR